jgi:hypothetical protein
MEEPVGQVGPWRTGITLDELDAELRMVRAACYVFIVALSAMRDSEIQEIERDAMATFFGSPAVTSRKVKNDPAHSHQHWWIIELVAEAIAVAERLSWHPTYIFASITPPKTTAEGKRRHGRRGINAASDIDQFIERINTTCGQLGLEAISPAHVRPHMFRRTMSLIAGREPDAEIALGLQLKHAARRAVSNRSTPAYGQMDAGWAKEFDRELEFAAARKLVSLLKDRHRGETIAVGPGAARLHAGLDQVLTTIEADPQLRAQLADETMMATLLHSQFPELHWGTLNHCLFDAPQAECQEGLPEAQRGQGPLLGACQPAKCRNSAITRAHAPICPPPRGGGRPRSGGLQHGLVGGEGLEAGGHGLRAEGRQRPQGTDSAAGGPDTSGRRPERGHGSPAGAPFHGLRPRAGGRGRWWSPPPRPSPAPRPRRPGPAGR